MVAAEGTASPIPIKVPTFSGPITGGKHGFPFGRYFGESPGTTIEVITRHLAPGVEAVVRVPEMPGRDFHGTVTRIADALQPGTRTLLTEIDVPNPNHELSPGTYCTVELKIPRKTPSLIVPSEAIIFNREGLSVAVIENGVPHEA